MRSHLFWLTTGLLGLVFSASSALLVPGIASAQDGVASTTSTTSVAATDAPPDATLPELAPGESPGVTEAESGPVLTFAVPDSSTSTTDVVPAGPVVFDPVPGNNALGNNTRTVMFLLILTAVPSLTVGTALWIHRDQPLNRGR